MTSRSPIPLLCVLAALLMGVLLWDLLNFTVDDVFITLRYTENFVKGHGLVYNIGESVEGYSDWLWLMLLSVPASLGLTHEVSPFALMWFAKGLSLLFGLSTICALYALANRHFAAKPYAAPSKWLCVLGLSTSAPFVLWMIGGLETTLCSLFFVLAVYLSQRIFEYKEKASKPLFIGLGMIWGLAAMTRPELPFPALLTFGMIWYTMPRLRKTLTLWCILPFGLLLGGFLLFRWQVFHELVPNTFYAKTGVHVGALGIKYILAGLGLILGPFFLGGFGLLASREYKDWTILLSLLLIGSMVLFALYSNGDWMPGYRFLVPVAPLLILCSVAGVRWILEQVLVIARPAIPTWSTFALIAIVAASTAMVGRTLVRDQNPTMKPGFLDHTGHGLPDHERVANWIKVHYPDGCLAGMNEGGMIGYLNPQMRLLDFAGLMDKHIALGKKHRKPFDINYVLGRKPDIIMLTGYAEYRGNMNEAEYFPELNSAEGFRNGYRVSAILGNMVIYERIY